MTIYLRLIFEFFKTGLFSVGGGLATLPFLYEMSRSTGWFTEADVADMIAISESTPGAIGINMATYAGFKTAGPLGGICATIGLALPSIIIIIIIATFLDHFSENRYVNRAFYGLRPASIAMVTAALVNVVRVALVDLSAYAGPATVLSVLRPIPIVMAVILFFVMRKIKWHPVIFLAISAVVGIVLKL
ncbi:MAG: chromate transporter [Lachnospiraceae bacterium]|nr:chromate transporter [Lachnospiraceae bacterium]